MTWKQEERWHAKEDNHYYRVSLSYLHKFEASVSFMGEDGSFVTEPIGPQFETIQEAKAACEEDSAKRKAAA